MQSNSEGATTPWLTDCMIPQKRRLSNSEDQSVPKRRLLHDNSSIASQVANTLSPTAQADEASCSPLSAEVQVDAVDSDDFEILERDELYRDAHSNTCNPPTMTEAQELEYPFPAELLSEPEIYEPRTEGEAVLTQPLVVEDNRLIDIEGGTVARAPQEISSNTSQSYSQCPLFTL
ncbi:hypothetical protein NM688_g6999 [Phlebia brevispora]|uniref:Uncharacterized protein n=1 Tax=Phlebia brevispora TaxID=194682 RepID=A0ACC1SA35_9APHY|nr:hypothetical protein NM688_g6999 [Phlebia brevispora]